MSETGGLLTKYKRSMGFKLNFKKLYFPLWLPDINILYQIFNVLVVDHSKGKLYFLRIKKLVRSFKLGQN